MPLSPADLEQIVSELARRPGHEETRVLVNRLLTEGLGAEISEVSHEVRLIEAPGRIDALLGRTILEYKKNLTRERRDAEQGLTRYLTEYEGRTGQRFVGVATDGLEWRAYEMRDGALTFLREVKADGRRAQALLAWLDGAVATRQDIVPDALTVPQELGQESIAFRRASADLAAAWAQVATHPTASLQRQLWSQLLTLVYGQEVESDELWFQHTYLVIVAKTIAAQVLGLEADDPAALMDGRAFYARRVFGAVESDFFDWVLLAPGGPELVQRLARHVARFRLREVRIDLMKILYESLIDPSQRKGLGEYYTPDWLASKVARHTIDRPLEQKVLDPACGSGAFLFHAVRLALAEAEEAGVPPERQAPEASRLVAGMDIHPVAVIIARVTYLLALAPALGRREGDVSIPVYLGDSMQLEVSRYMREQVLSITVPPAPGEAARALVAGGTNGGGRSVTGAAVLTFPESLCRLPAAFDQLIESMRTGADEKLTREAFVANAKRIVEETERRAATDAEKQGCEDLGLTFLTFAGLKAAGRDSIWTYVARNLARPLAYSAFGGWANVLVGNPPWVAFRHMSRPLQARFKALSKEERINAGGKLATQEDLCALFTVRAAGLYLRAAGRIAFVLPLAVMTRGQFARFRSGAYTSAQVQWEEAWTMDDGVQPLFPVPSCVLFGRRRATARPVPDTVRAYAGRLPVRDAYEAVADARLTVTEGAPAPTASDGQTRKGGSEFQGMFRQGATLVPRMLCLVKRTDGGTLGVSSSRPLVESRRNAQEKRPWRNLPGLQAAVEARFVRPVLLGESILPFRVFRPVEGVIPVEDSGEEMMSASKAANAGCSGLASWMRPAEAAWLSNQQATISLTEQFNYYGKLTAQFPIRPLRVVYAKAGMHPAATVVKNDRAVIDHKLYWATPDSEDEAYHLVAILNSEAARRRTEHLQSRGLFGARDFDKVIFTLPIPRFDAAIALHGELAAAGREAEVEAGAVDVGEGEPFQRARRKVRDALRASGLSERIDVLVDRLLDA